MAPTIGHHMNGAHSPNDQHKNSIFALAIHAQSAIKIACTNILSPISFLIHYLFKLDNLTTAFEGVVWKYTSIPLASKRFNVSTSLSLAETFLYN